MLASSSLLASAQEISSIAGVVSDASGASVPNVAVQVKSPALIEQFREVTTDSVGRYRFVNLPPGIYSVTVGATGFKTTTQADIQLTADFNAEVNLTLEVGQQNQAVTVESAPPVVDTQSVTNTEVLTRSELDALPTGRSPENDGILIPGAQLAPAGSGVIQRDVGGTGLMNQSPLIYHGSPDTEQLLDGFRRVYFRGSDSYGALGQFSGAYINEGAVQEMSFGTGTDVVDFGADGMRQNLVPREGANGFHFSVFFSFANGDFTTTNLDQKLISTGFTVAESLKKLYDFNPTFTGPIIKNKLWFTASARYWGVTNTAPVYYNTNAPSLINTYVPNLSQPATDPGYIWDATYRVTWQIDKKDKISFLGINQERYRQYFSISATTTPQAAQDDLFPSYTYQAHWTRVQNEHLIFDAGYERYYMQHIDEYEVTSLRNNWCYGNILNLPGTPPPFYAIHDTATGYSYNVSGACSDDMTVNNDIIFNTLYVTGSHVMKFGGTLFNGQSHDPSSPLGYTSLTYLNGVPNSITVTLPKDETDQLKADLGLYFQDKWIIKRKLTLNYGLRANYVVTGWPSEVLPANPFTAAASFPGRSTFLNWKDLSPRVGVAYDPFGKAKTSLRFSFARYDVPQTLTLTADANPLGSISTSETLTWKDLAGTGTPYEPGTFTFIPGELGPSSNVNFGKLVQTTTVDPKLQNGWFRQPFVEEAMTGLQQQLRPGLAVTGEFYYRWSGNQEATENLAIPRSAYTGPFCLTAPTNAGLPGGGGYPICNLYDVEPAYYGLTNNLITLASNIGGEKQHSTGFTFSTIARLSKTTIQGGIDVRDDYSNTCGLLNGPYFSPESATFPGGQELCKTNTGFKPDIKIAGSRTLVWGLRAAATYQNAAPANLTATNPYTSAQILPVLGRNLAAGATATKSVNLLQPNTVWGPRLNQLDARLSKTFSFKEKYRATINLDLYNITNNNYIVAYTTSYATLGKPNTVLSPRLFKIGGQFNF